MSLIIVLVMILMVVASVAYQRHRSTWRPGPGEPREPMTPEQAYAYLRRMHPCGCEERWDTSPPSGMSCSQHIGSFRAGPPPRYLGYAHRILREQRQQEKP